MMLPSLAVEKSLDGNGKLDGKAEPNIDAPHIDCPPEAPAEDMLGMTMASLMIDTRAVMLHEENIAGKHAFRLFVVLLLQFLTLGTQVYLTLMTKMMITPQVVANIRKEYGHYEAVMYDNHTRLTENGHARGIPGFFNVTNFQYLTPDQQDTVCQFALTKPGFTYAILTVWTLTCLRYMRRSLQLMHRIIVLPTVSSMAGPDVIASQGKSKKKVIGVTLCVKFAAFCLLLVCLAQSSVLLWIGCRWLLATISFQDVLLNAVALEFVLNLHELIYSAAAPYSMRRALYVTLVSSPVDREEPTWSNMVGAFSVILLAMLFAYWYTVFFQKVLPDYQWDVASVCEQYGKETRYGGATPLFSWVV